jgi:phenylalanyl-tRNA synthetase beta subunit
LHIVPSTSFNVTIVYQIIHYSFRSLAEVQVKRVSPASSSSAITSAASAAASSISSWGGWASSWFRKTEPVPTAAGAATTPTASTPEKQQPHEEKYSFLGVDMTEEDLKEIYSSLRLDDTENEIGATNKPPPEVRCDLAFF